MYLVSTGKSTILSDFVNLATKTVYQHANEEATDFQFYAKQRIFLEVNKKSGLEVLRLKRNIDHHVAIQRVRKMTIENLFCGACAKNSLEEMALGLCNGQVKLYNYKKGEFMHRFKAENIRSSVVYLDYNASDEYIASVMESGLINIYGTKTRTKIDTANIDGKSTLARFHPSKRFHLAVASHRGCVTIYDAQSKKKLFNAPESHDAPCRDLCISVGSPDTLISVGYDCIINIFDTRRKSKPVKLTYTHPLSTVTISDCGTFFCVGNLKGELSTYDMRNTKECLATAKVHDCAVTRVSFVPGFGEGDSSCSLWTAANEIEEHISADLQKPTVDTTAVANKKTRDSFCDFLDNQSVNTREKISSRFLNKHDSFEWETRPLKPNNFSFSLGSTTHNSGISSICDAIEALDAKTDVKKNNIKSSPSSLKVTTKKSLPLIDLFNNENISPKIIERKLVLIEEEQQELNKTKPEKENCVNLKTPLIPQFNNGDNIPDICNEQNKTVSLNELQEYFEKLRADLNSDMNVRFQQLENNFKNEMNERVQQLEGELKFQAETNKWQIFTQAANLSLKLNYQTEDMRDSLAVLLQTDPFANELRRLKQENYQLKAELKALKKK